MDFDALSKMSLGDLLGRANDIQDKYNPSDSDYALKLAVALADAMHRGKEGFEQNAKEILSLFSGGDLTPELIEQGFFPTEEPVTVTKTTTSVGNTPVEENVETSTPDTTDALAQELSMSDDEFQKLLDEIPDDDAVSGKNEPPKDFGEVPGEKEAYIDAAKSKAEKGKPAEDMGSTPEEKEMTADAEKQATQSEEPKEEKPAEESKKDDKPANEESESKKEDKKQEQSDTDKNIISTLTDLK
jgi:hypothetical protein